MGTKKDSGDGLTEVKQTKGNGLGLTRRRFLKLTALTGLSATAFGINRPSPVAFATQSIPSGSKGRWIPTSCMNCSARCGIIVKVQNGRVVQIKGNRFSIVSEGQICPRGHIGLQVLYDPERIFTPLKRSQQKKGMGIDPQWKPISWDQAIEEITRKLRSLREAQAPHRLLLFSGLNSRCHEDLLLIFAEAYGTPNLISGEGLEDGAERVGHWMADGRFEPFVYDLDHTHYILSFGADLLESTPPVARWLRKWGKMRRERPIRTKVVDIQPRYSLTASKSDEWIPIHPGTDAALAMGIAHVILKEGLFDHEFINKWTTGFDQYREIVLKDYKPETVSNITGIPAETIYRVAREFAQTRPALAIAGKGALAWPAGSYVSYAIYCLNALVGSIDIPGGVLYQEFPGYRTIPKIERDEISRKGFAQVPIDFRKTEFFPAAQMVTNQIPRSLIEGKPYPIEMAIGFNSNFIMTAPGAGAWEEALRKIPFFVHIAPFMSEMAMFADILLPSTTYLEEWGYEHSSPGAGVVEVRIKQPVVKPMGESKSIGEILFLITERMPGVVSKTFKIIGNSTEEFVRWRSSSMLPWEEFLKKGVWRGERYEYRKYSQIFQTPSRRFEFVSGNLKILQNERKKGSSQERPLWPHYTKVNWLGDEKQYPFILFPYQPLLTFENGSQNYPWAQEIFLPMQGVGWASPVEMNPETAKGLNLKDQDRIWIESPFGRIQSFVKISEGVPPGLVCIPSGQGHISYGRWQKGIGCNPNEVIGVDFDRISGQSAFFNTRVKIYKA